MAESVDRKKARFTERPFSALSPPRPADHPSGWSLGSRPRCSAATSVTRDFLPERSAGPEGWTRRTDRGDGGFLVVLRLQSPPRG